jgi:hypothetical protein
MTNKKEKFVEELRDAHRGEEIWVIGTGSSLNDFPLDFFDDKITIAINGAIYKYPGCTYWHGHHEVWREYLRDEKPEFLEKSIICYPMPGDFPHNTPRTPEGFFGELTSLPYWLYFLDSCVLSKGEVAGVVKQINEKVDKVSFRACETVGHIAMEIAYLMGADNITLAGCEHKKFPKTDSHCDIGIPYPWNAYWGGRPEILRTTHWLAELFEENGVEMQRYYNADTEFYKKGYEEIGEIQSEE